MTPSEATPLVDAAAARERIVDILSQRTALVVVATLLASLILNIVVLLPGVVFVYLYASPSFMADLIGTDTWGILTAINQLGALGQGFLVGFLWFFSIIWPFAKLLWVAILLVWPMRAATRSRVLQLLGQLGRLSLLDVRH